MIILQGVTFYVICIHGPYTVISQLPSLLLILWSVVLSPCLLSSVVISSSSKFFSAGMRNENVTTISYLHITFISWWLQVPHLSAKQGVREQDGTYNHLLWASLTNFFLTLKLFWSSDWNHSMRAMVSDWHKVQQLSTIWVNYLYFSLPLKVQDIIWMLH